MFANKRTLEFLCSVYVQTTNKLKLSKYYFFTELVGILKMIDMVSRNRYFNNGDMNARIGTDNSFTHGSYRTVLDEWRDKDRNCKDNAMRGGGQVLLDLKGEYDLS